MTMYGLNFNGTQIPTNIRRKFAVRRKFEGMGKGTFATLQGVATSIEDSEAMVSQASNERRHVIAVPRTIAGGTWFGIYIY